MQQELKDAIIKKVQEDKDTFNLVNHITTCFSEYIYNRSGEYLIGGEQVSKFISNFISIYIEN